MHKITPIKFIRKMKAHERKALVPIYVLHAEYLMRLIASAAPSITATLRFIEEIPSFLKVATCHEVAINETFDLDVATHNNPLGQEQNYSNHAKAKNVSRDNRVRIIWALLYKKLLQNPGLDGIQLFDLTQSIKCPVCESIWYQTRREIVGYHQDETENIAERLEFEQFCDCVLLAADNTGDDVMGDELDKLADFNYLDAESFVKNHLEFHLVHTNDENGTRVYALSDFTRFREMYDEMLEHIETCETDCEFDH